MIFTPFGTALDTKNYGKLQATIFGKSYSDIAKNGLLGNTSQLTSDIDNARTALEKFFAGTNEQRGSLDHLNDCIKDTSAEFKNYVGTLDMTHASVQSLQSILDGFASSQGFVAKAMTLVQNVGLKLLTTFGSMAITFAVSAAINALVKHFIELAQAEEKARDAAIDSGKELTQYTSDLDSYKSKINELKESLDSGTLSEQEAYQARKDLLDVQDELIDKYGSEVEGVDLLNGSLETQIALLDKLSNKKASTWLNENAEAIKKAQQAMTTDNWKQVAEMQVSNDSADKFQDLVDKYADRGMKIRLTDGVDENSKNMRISITADATDGEQVISDFMDDLEKLNSKTQFMNDTMSSNLENQMSSAMSYYKEISDTNKSLAEQAAKAQIQLNDTWSKTYNDLTEAQETYNDAVSKNDDKAIAAALKKVKAAQEEFANTDIDNSFVQQYMQEQADQLDSATKLQAVQTGLSETFKGATSNYKSLNDYLDVTDHKAEQLTDSITYNLNELKGLDDIDILNIGSLEKAGSASKNYTDEQIASYNRLKGVADQLGISIDDLVDIFVKVGLVTSDNIKYTNEFTSSALTMATTASKAISSVTSILNSQGTGVNVDTDSYSELIKDNAEYAAALEYSNGRMQLNREMATKLTKAKSDEAKANIEVAYSQNQMKYSAVKADMAAVDKQLKENNNLTDDQREKLEDAKAALESQSKTLRDNCTSLRMQYSALVQASSAYQDWLNAQNAAEAGDMYNDGMDAKQAIAAGLKNGKIGTEKYKAAVEFLVPDDFKGDVQTYIKKLNRYFKEASDGSIDASGLNNFITDSIKAGLMKDEGDGKIQMIADTTIEDFADALQLTPDAVQSIFGELQEYGWNFDWDSMLGNELDNTRMKLDDIKDQMADLDPDTEAWKILNDQAEKLQEKLDGLYEKSGIDQMVSDINDVLKDTGSLTGNQKDDLLGMGRVQTMVDLYDAQQRLIEAQKAFNANPGDLNIAQELTDAQKQVEELTQKKEKLGDPTALEIQVYTQDAIDKLGNVEGAADQVTDKLEKAGVLTVESDDDPVKETDKEIDNVQEKAKKPITLKVDNVQCLSGIQDVATALKDISGETTVTVRYKTFGKPASTPSTKKTYAEQRSYAYGGASNGGRTLVGELGNELVVNPHTGKWYTVGDNGAEFVDLPKDAIVFDHKKTEKLLGQGFVGARGFAYAMGNAKADGENSKINGGGGYMIGKNPATSKTYTKATKDNTKAVEENKKALEKQKTALEKQKDALEKESNKLKIYGQAAINEIEKRITALNKEKDAQDKVYESQIKELEKRKEALQKANDEEDRAIKLAELQDALEKAKANRTVRIYNKNEGFVWRADQQAVSDAQNDLDDQKRQWKNDDILQAVDDEIERINNLKDAYDESIEAQIDDLDNMKEKWDEVISLIGTSWEDYQAQLAAAAEFNGMSLDGMAGALDGYKDDVIANMKAIGDTSAEIDRVTEAMDALEEASSKSGGSSSGGSDASEGFGIDDGSTIGDGLFDGLSDSAKAAKEELDELLERYEDLGDRNEGLSESQLALVDSISQMTVGTKEYSMANMELSDIQSIVGDRYTEMGDLAEQYRESVLTNNELTWEQKDALLSSFDEIVTSYSTGYDTIDGLMQNYMDTLVSNTELSTADYQAQMDALVAFADQHGVSYDSIIQYLYNTEEELRNTGATTEEISSAMSSAVSAACSAMNASYDSVIAKLVELKKQQSAMNAVKGAAGGINANTVARYATGVIGAATTHIAITDEQGPEIKMRKPSAGNYSLIERGSSVIPAQPSANIWKMGLDPEQFISQHMPQRSIKSVEITQPDAGGVSVSVGDIQMYGVNDVESFGRVIHERVGTIFAQEFSRR
nr:MAG TPA: chromosome segregation ATPase [Caudoviricetes sp.]